MASAEDPVNYLTPADIYSIAEEILGRRPDVRDRRVLRSSAARPMLTVFGEEAYPTLMDKAAALLHALAAHHPFFDGNKRTATVATVRFLQANNLQPTWDDQTIYDFVLAIAQNRYDVPAIAAWLTENTQ